MHAFSRRRRNKGKERKQVEKERQEVRNKGRKKETRKRESVPVSLRACVRVCISGRNRCNTAHVLARLTYSEDRV